MGWLTNPHPNVNPALYDVTEAALKIGREIGDDNYLTITVSDGLDFEATEAFRYSTNKVILDWLSQTYRRYEEHLDRQSTLKSMAENIREGKCPCGKVLTK